ncbi:hypothetical protein VTK73DRAFT_4822 [Phialemonium thermophilum]|uniref:Uncharacterized protein n=1 Tax=Phialemonium thermophilum TaxID=223376 RepID=A0ABR3WS46_9PEZI
MEHDVHRDIIVEEQDMPSVESASPSEDKERLEGAPQQGEHDRTANKQEGQVPNEDEATASRDDAATKSPESLAPDIGVVDASSREPQAQDDAMEKLVSPKRLNKRRHSNQGTLDSAQHVVQIEHRSALHQKPKTPSFGKAEPRMLPKSILENQRGSTADSPRLGSKSRSKEGSYANDEAAVENETSTKFHADLLTAIKNGDAENLRRLISSHPEFLNAKFGKSQETPLLLAIRNGKSVRSLVDTILEFNRPLKEQNISRGSTALTSANDTVGVDVNAQDVNGRTALMVASGRRLLDVADLLLTKGADINAQDKDKETALFCAVVREQKDVVKSLLKGGANPNIANGKGQTPLHMAARKGNLQLLELLLVDDTVDIDSRDIDGRTPLYEACKWGRTNVVEELIKYGADVNAKTTRNWTPLHIAARFGAANMVQELLKAGADTAVFTRTLDTPESLVPKDNTSGIVELLKRTDLEDSSNRSGLRRDENVSKPTPGQDELCRHFQGFIWPSVNKRYLYDTLSVWDMLYSESPRLAMVNSPPAPVWIHLPANVIVWVEDAFKRIYSRKLKEAPGKNTTAGEPSPANEKTEPIIRNILHFLDSHLDEIGTQGQTCFRQPHYKCAVGPKSRLRTFENHMISVVIPIVDVDMQQPYYFKKDDNVLDDDAKSDESDSGTDEPQSLNEEMSPARKRQLVKKYTTSEGRALTEKEKEHVKHMRELKKKYRVHMARTLDESFHESLEKADLNHRNSDQVLSRALGRFRLEVESRKGQKYKGKRDAANMAGTDAPNTARGTDGYATRRNEESRGPQHDETQDVETTEPAIDTCNPTTTAEQQDTADGKQTTSGNGGGESVVRGSQGPAREPTPSELESQVDQGREKLRKWLVNILSRFQIHGKPTQNEESAGLSEDDFSSSYGDYSDSDRDIPDSDFDSDSNSDSNSHSEAEMEDNDHLPRQQILTVPQLWIWKVDNVIVTAFPDRWDSSNPRVLSKFMLASVQERKKEKMPKDIDVQGVLHAVIDSCLGFEALFTAFNETRSANDAFALEIAHISRQTDTCYSRYRESLGKTEESFASAVREETELLMAIDDILSEIAMIKRVHQDQAKVCGDMKTAEGIIAQSAKKNHIGSPRLGYESPTRPAPTNRLVTESPQLDAASFQENHETNLVPSPHVATRLERLEEDAKRVRESIITLLDLRQRQASTESAINSGKQSQILFEQSKVLFIFTGATVLFAPLSWVSSLLALKIDRFTPDAWHIGQAFGASFGSLLGTFLLCFVWAAQETILAGVDAVASDQPVQKGATRHQQLVLCPSHGLWCKLHDPNKFRRLATITLSQAQPPDFHGQAKSTRLRPDEEID